MPPISFLLQHQAGQGPGFRARAQNPGPTRTPWEEAVRKQSHVSAWGQGGSRLLVTASCQPPRPLEQRKSPFLGKLGLGWAWSGGAESPLPACLPARPPTASASRPSSSPPASLFPGSFKHHIPGKGHTPHSQELPCLQCSASRPVQGLLPEREGPERFPSCKRCSDSHRPSPGPAPPRRLVASSQRLEKGHVGCQPAGQAPFVFRGAQGTSFLWALGPQAGAGPATSAEGPSAQGGEGPFIKSCQVFQDGDHRAFSWRQVPVCPHWSF